MPTRMIREGFLDSEKVNALKPEEQLFFVRLMLIADDYGRSDGRIDVIRSRCYPVGETSLSQISEMLSSVCRVGLIDTYEVGGKKYVSIPHFDQRLRSKREKYPPPPERQACDGHVTDMRRACDGHVTGMRRPEEKRSRREEEVEGKSRFASPGYEQVKSYCLERKNSVDPERFVDHYAANGWMVGKTKMKDWRAAVRTWEKNAHRDNKPKYGNQASENRSPEMADIAKQWEAIQGGQ